MPQTPISLLARLRQCTDSSAWRRWFDLYRPIIHRFLRRPELQAADLEEVVGEVLVTVVREIPHFHHNGRAGAFRCWLRQVMANRLREFRRARRERPGGDGVWDRLLGEVESPDSGLAKAWDREHDQLVLRRMLELVEPEFEATTWQAFRRLVLDGEPAEQVAAALAISVNAARIAKCRVLSRLRQEAHDLIA
jgi:RNA polymerase sigma-70 factor (ECF subfamily)